MPKKHGITWHDPQEGESVRFWDEQEKRVRTGKVLRPAGRGNMVRIQPEDWEDGYYTYAHVTNVEPLTCECDACAPDRKRPLPRHLWKYGQRVTKTYHWPENKSGEGPHVYVGTIRPYPYDSPTTDLVDGIWIEWDGPHTNPGWYWDHSIRTGGGPFHSPVYALDEKPLNLREAEEIQPEDLQAAADMYDRLAKA